MYTLILLHGNIRFSLQHVKRLPFSRLCFWLLCWKSGVNSDVGLFLGPTSLYETEVLPTALRRLSSSMLCQLYVQLWTTTMTPLLPSNIWGEIVVVAVLWNGVFYLTWNSIAVDDLELLCALGGGGDGGGDAWTVPHMWRSGDNLRSWFSSFIMGVLGTNSTHCATFPSPSNDIFYSSSKLYMKHKTSFLEFPQHPITSLSISSPSLFQSSFTWDTDHFFLLLLLLSTWQK